MATAADTIAATAALVSAAITWFLGHRTAETIDRDSAYEQAWRLVEGYREEIDRLRARVTDLEQAMEHQRVEHETGRARWAAERRTLIAAFRRGDDPTPAAGRAVNPRVRAMLILAALFVLVMVIAAGLAYTAGQAWRVDDLDRRVTHLETDVSNLRE